MHNFITDISIAPPPKWTMIQQEQQQNTVKFFQHTGIFYFSYVQVIQATYEIYTAINTVES